MDQAEEPPIKNQQHPEEEEHHENGASKMFRKVKARAKKFKNSLANHGESHVHDHDVVEEDDEIEPEVIGGVTGKPESRSHPRETNVPAPEEITPPGTKVFPVVSSDNTKPVEAVPLQDTSYGHEAPSHSVRTTGILDKEERRDAPTHHHPLGVSELSDREESRESHHEPLNTPVSLLSSTEDVTRTSAPGGEDEYLRGQRKVNVETPEKSKVTDPNKEGSGEAGVPEIAESFGRMKVEDESSDQKAGHGFDRDLSTRSKEFREFDRDLESVVGKDSPVRFAGESDAELGKEIPTRSKEFGEFDRDVESVVGKDSPARFGGESDAELGKEIPTRSKEFRELDRDVEPVVGKDSPARFGGESGAELEKDSPSRSHDFDMTTESGIDKNSPSRSHEFDLKTESGIDKNSPMRFGSEPGAELGKEFPTERHEFDQKTDESGKNEYSPTESDGGSGAPMEGNFPVRSHELGMKRESGSDKNSPAGFVGESGTNLGEDFLAKKRYGYGEESEAGLEKNSPARSDDVKVETELGRDLPTGTHDQFSPELSRPKEEKDDFMETRDDFEETRDETREPKPSAYTEQFASGASDLTNQAIAAKNAVASKVGYSGETPVGDETQMAGSVDEKLTPVNEKDSETESTKLPLSGGGSGVEETEQKEDKAGLGKDYLSEKLTPGEEDKGLSEIMAEKLKLGGGEEKKAATTKEVEVEVEKIPTEKTPEEGEHGEADTEEVKGGGMVGMIKGWFGGGATEEVEPKSPHSVEESSQSLGSTVGTKGFSDSGGSELGETGGGSGAVPVQRGL